MASKYCHLTLDERRRIERWHLAKVSPRRMAKILGRHRSTIFRELTCSLHPKIVDLFTALRMYGLGSWS
jgi:IS30 family transposase